MISKVCIRFMQLRRRVRPRLKLPRNGAGTYRSSQSFAQTECKENRNIRLVGRTGPQTSAFVNLVASVDAGALSSSAPFPWRLTSTELAWGPPEHQRPRTTSSHLRNSRRPLSSLRQANISLLQPSCTCAGASFASTNPSPSLSFLCYKSRLPPIRAPKH
jgi:hypothetical protein